MIQIIENASLKKLNSFGMEVQAKYLAAVHSSVDILDLLDTIRQQNEKPSQSPLVLGGGSNILFTKNYDGWVIKNELKGIELIAEDDDHVYIKAGAGENWHHFVINAIAHNWAGVENLALIPGMVGASPMQNIGAYGVEIKDVFHCLEAVHIKEQRTQLFYKNDCAFGYRDSVFKQAYKNEFVITSVTYRLNKKPVFHTKYGAIEEALEKMQVQTIHIKAIADAVIHIRNSKLPDPSITGNAGSFFKNPTISKMAFMELQKQFPAIIGYPVGDDQIKLAAGWLIEAAGWKGFRRGDVGCHHAQALILVNLRNASGQDVYQLSEDIRASVEEKFAVQLDREVNII